LLTDGDELYFKGKGIKTPDYRQCQSCKRTDILGDLLLLNWTNLSVKGLDKDAVAWMKRGSE